MHKVFTFIYYVFFSTILFAQKELPAFGKVDIADLRMQSCSFEPDADAMKLFDIQEVEYEPTPFGGKIKTEKRVRLKIFNENGYRYATIKIPYYSNKKNTIITNLNGIIYTEDNNGNMVTRNLEETDFFKDKAMENIGILSFTFPNLRPGSIIEYSYTLTEKNRLQFDTWLIQAEIPTDYASNTLVTPTFSGFTAAVFGQDSVSEKRELVTKGLDKNKTTFHKEKIHSFKPEPFMSSARDNMLRMAYLLFPNSNIIGENLSPASTWKFAANLIIQSPFFVQQLSKVIPGTEKIIDTASTIPSVQEKINYLFTVVKKRISSRSVQAFFPDDIVDAWKSRSGSGAEINMILMNLLRRANIICHPVLVSTRENGKINTSFPSFGQFNGLHVLAHADGFNYLMDASLKYQSYDIPPFNVLNREVFILEPDNIRWAFISDNRPLLKQSTNIFSVLTKEGKIEAGATITYYDYAKSLALDSSTKDFDNNDKELTNEKIPGLKILSEKKEYSADHPLILTLEFDYEIEPSGEFYFINPQLLALKKTNPFTSNKRNTNIDFGCNQETLLNIKLEIPASFELEHLPKNIVVRSADSSFSFTRIAHIDHSNLTFSQMLEIKKPIFDKKEYDGLYEFFNLIQSLMAEEIIFRKKK